MDALAIRLASVAGHSAIAADRFQRALEAAEPNDAFATTTLVAECPVSFTTAALGGSISLPGIDGEQVELKIPAGIQSGEQLRHRGSGMSILNGRGRGDLVARILVETPTRMSKDQKKLLEEFRATETGDECPASKSFFSRARDFLGG